MNFRKNCPYCSSSHTQLSANGYGIRECLSCLSVWRAEKQQEVRMRRLCPKCKSGDIRHREDIDNAMILNCKCNCCGQLWYERKEAMPVGFKEETKTITVYEIPGSISTAVHVMRQDHLYLASEQLLMDFDPFLSIPEAVELAKAIEESTTYATGTTFVEITVESS